MKKELLFSAMLDNQNADFFESNLEVIKELKHYIKQAARVAANAKSRQDAAKNVPQQHLIKKLPKKILIKIKLL